MNKELLQTKNPELKKLDEEVYENGKQFKDFLSSDYTNVYAHEKLKRREEELKGKVQRTKVDYEFDEFILTHLTHILDAQLIISDCLFREEDNLNEVLDCIYGENTLGRIEEYIKRHPYEKHWEAQQLNSELATGLLESDTEDSRKRIKKTLPSLKVDILPYIKKMGMVPENFDFRLELAPIYVKVPSWDDEIKTASIPGNSFVVYLKDNEIIIDKGFACKQLFHEMGHGGNYEFSKIMPKTLKTKWGIVGLINLIASEGRGLDAEEVGIQFIKENQKELNVSDAMLKYIEYSIEFDMRTHTIKNYYNLLRLKQMKNIEFQANDHFLKITNNRAGLLNLRFSNDSEKDIIYLIMNAAYFPAEEHLGSLKEKIKREFGNAYFEENQKSINSALNTGAWSWKVHPDFVLWYLEQLQK